MNPEAVLKRLPEAVTVPKIPLAEILVNTFKEARYQSEKQTVPKRQALKIKPGQSVSTEETLELMKVKETCKKIKKEKVEKISDTKENVPNNRKRRCTTSLASKAQKKPKSVPV